MFKKASADFDEGGAKGLLLNHLAIDSRGRIVFDSSDDAGEASAGDSNRSESGAITKEDGASVLAIESEQQGTPGGEVDSNVDIHTLGSRFFPFLAALDEQDICPSLKSFDLGDLAGSLDIPFLKIPEKLRLEKDSPAKRGIGDQTGIFLDGDNVVGFEDDGMLGELDVGIDAGFGEGGDAWAKNAAIDHQTGVGNVGLEMGNIGETQAEVGVETGGFNPKSNHYTVSLHNQVERGHEDILSYFDNALQKNWAGPEHWRIQRIKDNSKVSARAPPKRKEKESFEIDFLSPLDPSLKEMLYTPAVSNSAISLPKSQWKSKTRNLLPDDKHFNSQQLLRLFIKPKARIGSLRRGIGKQFGSMSKQADFEMDEAFWARKDNVANPQSLEEEAPPGDYDANFFQDDGLGFQRGPPDDDEEFADARETFSPGADGKNLIEGQGIDGVLATADGTQEGAFGSQLVTQSRRLRPEYVQYARVAKKVDVRRLKEEMWRGIGLKDVRFSLS